MEFEAESNKSKIETKNEFLDQVRKIRDNLKNFISWIFSVKKESESKLNELKENVNSNKNTLKQTELITESSTNSKPNNETVSESNEKNNGNLRETLLKIVSRSRKPGDVMKNDKWFVSIWILQRHGNTTATLLKQFKEHNPDRFKSIMTDPLFNNLEKAWKSVWNDRHVKQFKELMKDEWCVKLQKEMALKTVDEHLKVVWELWVTDPRATLAFWRICNYGPWHAKKVKNNMVKAWANINDYSQVIDYYEKSVTWIVRTKFQKKYPILWNKNLREFIWEYKW